MSASEAVTEAVKLTWLVVKGFAQNKDSASPFSNSALFVQLWAAFVPPLSPLGVHSSVVPSFAYTPALPRDGVRNCRKLK